MRYAEILTTKSSEMKNEKGLVHSIKIVCEPSWDIQALENKWELFQHIGV